LTVRAQSTNRAAFAHEVIRALRLAFVEDMYLSHPAIPAATCATLAH